GRLVEAPRRQLKHVVQLLRDRGPDRSGDRRAEDVAAVRTMRLARAQRQVVHAVGLLDRLTDPDGRRDLRRVADEPALLAVVRRTGLAGRVAADPGDTTRRTAGQHALEGLGHAVRDVLGQRAVAVRLRHGVLLAGGSADR